MKKDTLRTLAIVIGLLILLGIVALGSAVWLFVRSFDVGKADEATAARTLDEIRSRFPDVTPLLEIRNEEPVLVRQPPAVSRAGRLTTMHVAAWDPDDDDFVRIALPFWLLRLKSGPIEIASDNTRFSDRDLGITVAELERYGPTLVLDHHGRRGARVVIWTE